VVPGGLNTDIIGAGVPEIIDQGELSLGGKLNIGPGGKSANIARMAAVLTGPNRVAMIGRTARDPFGLWKAPIDALQKSGVNTDFVKIMNFEESGIYPGIALIPVDKEGNNQIYVLPGENENFSPLDLKAAGPLFAEAGKEGGILAMALELPEKTALSALSMAKEHHLRSVLDPGGMEKGRDYSELLRRDIFLIKPNEHEAKMLTGVNVTDLNTAEKAAKVFFNYGIKNVMITAGGRGAFLVTPDSRKHIPVPELKLGGKKDETGCGDQTTATLCALLAKGEGLPAAARRAVFSGTLQFYKSGIQPVTLDEIGGQGG